MKFKPLYFLSFALAAIMICTSAKYKMIKIYATKTPVKVGQNYSRPELVYITDTLNVNAENFEHLRKTAAAGLFIPSKNQITIFYFKTNETDPRIQFYCENNNRMIPLTRRHETEHARKAALTKITYMQTPETRGKIAASNEIIAPAAEIIEALDWHHTHGRAFPTTKNYIRRADRDIVAIMDSLKLPWPVNFNHSAIADVVITRALERFTSEFNRGQYLTTVRRAIQEVPNTTYTPNKSCDISQYFLFAPYYGDWGPLWEFDSFRGNVNIWNAASENKKKELQNALDKFVERASQYPGIKTPFLQNTKIR